MRISGWPQLSGLLAALYLAPVTYVMQAARPPLPPLTFGALGVGTLRAARRVRRPLPRV